MDKKRDIIKNILGKVKLHDAGRTYTYNSISYDDSGEKTSMKKNTHIMYPEIILESENGLNLNKHHIGDDVYLITKARIISMVTRRKEEEVGNEDNDNESKEREEKYRYVLQVREIGEYQGENTKK